MNYDEFITQVRYRAELGSRAEAVRTTRATLKTLGERLQSDEANDLASSLPTEIDRFVTTAESGQSFEYNEFVERVAERAETDSSEARFYAKVVIDVLDDAVPPEEREDVETHLPDDFEELLELTETGGYYGQ